jgi:hypothetical protein
MLNILGGLWRVWLVCFGFLFIVVILRFYTEPVKLNKPTVVNFQDLFSKNNIGKLVTVSGKVDYTLALSKEIYVNNLNSKLLHTEVYLPLFSVSSPNDFVVIRGGQEDVEKVKSRSAITNPELLKNQDYSITGRLEPISNLSNSNLTSFFSDELPKARAMSVPTLIINSAEVISVQEFGKEFVPVASVLLVLLMSSMYLQLYIDKKINVNK